MWLRANAPGGGEGDPSMDWLRKNAPAQGADANLGGTLQLGPLDTGIPIPASLEAGLVGAGKTFTNLIRGVQQPFTSNAPSNLSDVVSGSSPASRLKATVDEEAKLYKPLEQAHPLATTLGEIAPYMATGNPLALAAMSGAEYGTPEERATRAGLTYAGGKVAQGVGRLFGPQSMAAAPAGGLASDFFNYAPAAGNKWGIPLRAAQTTDSKPIQILDAVAANLPVSSGVIAKAKDASFQAFNRAVSQTMGEDSTRITPELLGKALDRSGSQIGDIMGRARAQLTPAQAQEVAHLSGVIGDLGPEGQVLTAKLGKVIEGMTNGQAMSGQTLRMLDSSLGRIMGSSNGDLRYAAANLQNIVRDAATASLEEGDAALLKTARAQNFNARQIADATKATPGALSPTQLLAQVNKYQRSARYGGGNDLAELARFAKPTLGDAIPNSGTAQRLFYQKMLTNPLTTIGSAGGALYGADQFGVNPADAVAGLAFPYAAARGMAGKPLSAAAKRLLQQSGGLLGLELAPQ